MKGGNKQGGNNDPSAEESAKGGRNELSDDPSALARASNVGNGLNYMYDVRGDEGTASVHESAEENEANCGKTIRESNTPVLPATATGNTKDEVGSCATCQRSHQEQDQTHVGSWELGSHDESSREALHQPRSRENSADQSPAASQSAKAREAWLRKRNEGRKKSGEPSSDSRVNKYSNNAANQTGVNWKGKETGITGSHDTDDSKQLGDTRGMGFERQNDGQVSHRYESSAVSENNIEAKREIKNDGIVSRSKSLKFQGHRHVEIGSQNGREEMCTNHNNEPLSSALENRVGDRECDGTEVATATKGERNRAALEILDPPDSGSGNNTDQFKRDASSHIGLDAAIVNQDGSHSDIEVLEKKTAHQNSVVSDSEVEFFMGQMINSTQNCVVSPNWTHQGSSGSPSAVEVTQTQPGFDYIQGRAAGRMPEWGRRRPLVHSASDLSRPAEEEEGNGNESKHSAIVVDMAELAPDADEAGVAEVSATAKSEVVQEATVSRAVSRSICTVSVVLEGVLIKSQRFLMKAQDGEHKCRCSPLHTKRGKIFLVASLVTIAAVALVATLLAHPNQSLSAGNGNEPLGRIIDPLSGMFVSENSPQRKALQWIANERRSSTRSDSSLSSLNDTTTLMFQRYGLAVLYFATGGPSSWNNMMNFLSPEPECEWKEDGRGIFCNDFNEVVEIHLDSNNLTNLLPLPELAAFPHLLNLSLANNSIVGLSNDYTEGFQSLLKFDLSYNDLSSTFPSSFSRLTALEWLNLESSSLSGSIPPTIGNMSSLVYLNLSRNRLNSTISSSWTELSSLETFYVSHNALNGTLPVGNALRENLKDISAGKNSLTGTIPSFSSYPSLEHIWLNHNKFHGSIPTSLGNMTNLKSVYFEANRLLSTIPPEIFASQSLEALVLGSNKLTGSLPNAISNGFVLLAIEKNYISGTIPVSFGNLPSLDGLSLHSNLLTGEIPSSIGDMSKNLTLLALEKNMLNSTVPMSLGRLQNLKW
eukprot:CAMPEP_0113588038 /NCGR_PEP_ID=MMETSP0015_2-20120614/35271_1 /TAXON_ID=2838 /ORGANISM="Odontella" /LENGTH=988 /DNA_ID=CAMNT_0000493823 /DNA_START=27 /DNA_END=2990 /DNA_ORIENTATION=+ /assembly_acc=CAM_ASM_000160